MTEPSIDSHIIRMKSLNADVFVNVATSKFAAQAIRKAAEIDWKPLQFLNNVSASVGVVMKPAGLEASQGIISSAYLKDPTDPQWEDYPDMKAWNQFLDKYYPDADRADLSVIYAYVEAQLLSSNSVWHLCRTKQASYRAGAARTLSRAEFLAGQMPSRSAVLQCLSGLAAIVLGILAVGATVLLTGSTLSGAVMGFMEPAVTRRGEALAQSPSGAAE